MSECSNVRIDFVFFLKLRFDCLSIDFTTIQITNQLFDDQQSFKNCCPNKNNDWIGGVFTSYHFMYLLITGTFVMRIMEILDKT